MDSQIRRYSTSAVEYAAELIRQGGVVAFPTETVYGLGADVRNASAVARIFELKKRPSIDPLIVHVSSATDARQYGEFPEPLASKLMQRFWPGPLTLVVAKKAAVPSIVTAGLETVGLRMPAHAAALGLLRAAGTGIAAPSANPFGYVSPTRAEHVAEQLPDVELILVAGPALIGVESTILSLVGKHPCILRAGGVPIEELEEFIGPVEWAVHTEEQPHAPGQLARHYATFTPLQIRTENHIEALPRSGERVGLLALTRPAHSAAYSAVEILSETGDLREAAANLFAALHRLDRLQLDRIVALPVPEERLGIAIMDRLRRCSAR